MELSHREGQEIIVLSDGLAMTFCRFHRGSISSKIKEARHSLKVLKIFYNMLQFLVIIDCIQCMLDKVYKAICI